MVPTIWHSGKGKRMETVKRFPGLQGEEGRGEWVEQGIFRETTPYDTVVVDTCHYIFVKTHRMYNTKGEP